MSSRSTAGSISPTPCRSLLNRAQNKAIIPVWPVVLSHSRLVDPRASLGIVLSLRTISFVEDERELRWILAGADIVSIPCVGDHTLRRSNRLGNTIDDVELPPLTAITSDEHGILTGGVVPRTGDDGVGGEADSAVGSNARSRWDDS